MTVQRLHSGLAPIDVLTRVELEEVMNEHVEKDMRSRFRGLDIVRFPLIVATATAATLNLGATGNDMTPCGPSEGDIWMIRHVNVVSNLFATDTAKYILFRGSTPSDIVNAYSARFLLEAQALGGQPQSVGYAPGTKLVYAQPGEQIYAQVLGATVGNIYILSGEAIRVPAEMKGKIA